MPYNGYAPVESFLEREGKWVGWDKGGYNMSPLQNKINEYRKDQVKRNPILKRASAESAPKEPMTRETKA